MQRQIRAFMIQFIMCQTDQRIYIYIYINCVLLLTINIITVPLTDMKTKIHYSRNYKICIKQDLYE